MGPCILLPRVTSNVDKSLLCEYDFCPENIPLIIWHQLLLGFLPRWEANAARPWGLRSWEGECCGISDSGGSWQKQSLPLVVAEAAAAEACGMLCQG